MAFIYLLMRSVYNDDQGRPIRVYVRRRCHRIDNTPFNECCEFRAHDNGDADFSKLRLSQRNKS